MNPLEALKLARRPQPALEAQLGPVTSSVMPMLPQGILGPLRGLLGAKAPMTPAINAAETLGEANPEFTPVGGEGLYNVAKTGVKAVTDPLEHVYAKILATMGK